MTTQNEPEIPWSTALEDPLASIEGHWFDGKVAVVAGGGLSGPLGNVGFGMAWLFARSGARVAVLDRDLEAGKRTAEMIREAGGEAAAYDVDLTDEESTKAAAKQVFDDFGRIDVVATSIGGGHAKGIFEVSLEEWKLSMDLNLVTAWLLMRAVEPYMTEGGAIVTVSSGAAEGRGPALPYGIAKTALEKLSVGAASTLAPRGIRVNCVRVGMIWGAFAARGMSEDRREMRRKNVALQTEGTAWDIASAAYWLCTPQARWVSGQVLSVDGGGFAMRNTGAAGSK
ncbi:SDR family NAD(P)-dependent oxidoreductase [Nocardioides sp. DS6]|uniref:SDR family NAD(P)-dependent oxidoreductase n=1 Tax=Nocardioides eburneus TaxID=3231482 RepID=A0ABV3T4T6_9ACTN